MIDGVKRILHRSLRFCKSIADLVSSKWAGIVGHSMHPTLRHGQRVRVSRLAYLSTNPQRWDIVFFEHPERDGFWEVKRVVGLPNEDVRLESNHLFIDDVEIQDSFASQHVHHANQRWQLKYDEYFLLGDNRMHSTDSREFGAVTRRRIAGKVLIPDPALGKNR